MNTVVLIGKDKIGLPKVKAFQHIEGGNPALLAAVEMVRKNQPDGQFAKMPKDLRKMIKNPIPEDYVIESFLKQGCWVQMEGTCWYAACDSLYLNRKHPSKEGAVWLVQILEG